MRKLIFLLAAMAIAAPASAQTHVRGYIKKDGTYVQPHVRSTPNASTTDNWSSKPNYNPYTGQQGTQNPQPQTYQWQQPQQQQPVQPRYPASKPVCPYGSQIC